MLMPAPCRMSPSWAKKTANSYAGARRRRDPLKRLHQVGIREHGVDQLREGRAVDARGVGVKRKCQLQIVAVVETARVLRLLGVLQQRSGKVPRRVRAVMLAAVMLRAQLSRLRRLSVEPRLDRVVRLHGNQTRHGRLDILVANQPMALPRRLDVGAQHALRASSELPELATLALEVFRLQSSVPRDAREHDRSNVDIVAEGEHEVGLPVAHENSASADLATYRPADAQQRSQNPWRLRRSPAHAARTKETVVVASDWSSPFSSRSARTRSARRSLSWNAHPCPSADPRPILDAWPIQPDAARPTTTCSPRLRT